jgi:hypothetical protein
MECSSKKKKHNPVIIAEKMLRIVLPYCGDKKMTSGTKDISTAIGNVSTRFVTRCAGGKHHQSIKAYIGKNKNYLHVHAWYVIKSSKLPISEH